MDENKNVDNVVDNDENKERLEKNKTILASSPLAVDSSSINVNSTKDTPESVTNVVSETQIDTNAKEMVLEKEEEVGAFEEVSVTVDSSSLDLKPEEINQDSVFNKVVETKEEKVNMGEEKHKFPFFVVLVFILIIVFAFNLDKVNEYVKQKMAERNGVVEEEVEKKVSIYSLEDIKTLLDESTYLSEYSRTIESNIDLNIDLSTNKMSLIASDIIANSQTKFERIMEYSVEDKYLVGKCDKNVKDYCNNINTIITYEIATKRSEKITFNEILSDIENQKNAYNNINTSLDDNGDIIYKINIEDTSK